MKTLSLVLTPAFLLAACSGATPQYDSKFGHAVMQARHNMIIDHEAGKQPDLVAGMEGKQAVQAVAQYERSFSATTPQAQPQIISVGNLAQGQNGAR
jgi:hypothetical protein